MAKKEHKPSYWSAALLFIFAVALAFWQYDGNKQLENIQNNGTTVQATVTDENLRAQYKSFSVVEFNTVQGKHIKAELSYRQEQVRIGQTLQVIYLNNDPTIVVPASAKPTYILYAGTAILLLFAVVEFLARASMTPKDMPSKN